MERYCPLCDKYTIWSPCGDIVVCEIWRLGVYHDFIIIDGRYVGGYGFTGPLGHPFYRRSYAAMLREADIGMFDPAMWAPTFPELTDEIVGTLQKKVSEALPDKIPRVLSAIVFSFYVNVAE